MKCKGRKLYNFDGGQKEFSMFGVRKAICLYSFTDLNSMSVQMSGSPIVGNLNNKRVVDSLNPQFELLYSLKT